MRMQTVKHFIVALLMAGTCLAAYGETVQDALKLYKTGNYASALKMLRPLVDQRDPTATYIFGVLHLKGQGVPKDFAKAIELIRISAEAGYVRAQHDMGLLYGRGEYGVGKDSLTAITWYKKAAAQNESESMYNIGVILLNGDGVPTNRSEACRWFLMSAEAGNTHGQSATADCFKWKDGLGVFPDRAQFWKSKAAIQGVTE